ncbi:MAG TPA: hypothetical protein VGF64_02675 [Acidimicrobiales bacterium]
MREEDTREARRGGRRGRWESGHPHDHGPPWRGRRGRRGRRESVTPLSVEEARGWLSGRLPADWFTGAPEVTVDRDEIVVVGTLDSPPVAEGAGEAERQAAEAGRLERFREDTREARMAIHNEAEARFDRAVAWGAVSGDTRRVFTNLAVPVLTRLRQPERLVLDTLVDAGVAGSRSEALAWCVRLVGDNQEEWLGRLRQALSAVEEARETGPGSGA